MKRIKLLVAIASMALLLVAFSAPAMAKGFNNFNGGSVLGPNFDADVLDNNFGDFDDDAFDGDGFILVSHDIDDDDDDDFEIDLD